MDAGRNVRSAAWLLLAVSLVACGDDAAEPAAPSTSTSTSTSTSIAPPTSTTVPTRPNVTGPKIVLVPEADDVDIVPGTIVGGMWLLDPGQWAIAVRASADFDEAAHFWEFGGEARVEVLEVLDLPEDGPPLLRKADYVAFRLRRMSDLKFALTCRDAAEEQIFGIFTFIDVSDRSVEWVSPRLAWLIDEETGSAVAIDPAPIECFSRGPEP